MSALAHMLESRGFPTIAIALVLSQAVKTRPPRTLVVPFMLGRPLGEPNDAAFQLRVLRQALTLLERGDGPVVLEHFPYDNPSATDRPAWLASVQIPSPVDPLDTSALGAAFGHELTQVLPAWERFRVRFGRTSVGLSGLPLVQWPGFAASCLNGAVPTCGPHETPALSMRFWVDDIKALYGEAVQAEGDPPSAGQVDRWFWRQTIAGQLVLALRTAALESPNSGLRTVASRFLVPVPHLP